MKYKIIIDSNFVWHDDIHKLDQIFNSNLDELSKFITEFNLGKDVGIFIPEVVLHERVTQIETKIKHEVGQIKSSLKNLSVFGVKDKGGYQKPYKINLIKNGHSKIKELGLSYLKIPKIQHKVILERALNRVTPFKDKDKGYKDTLLWFSLLEEARKPGSIILCTNNKSDFEDESLIKEFKNISGSEFFIISGLQEVKEFLDKNLVLNLGLKTLHKEIEDEIRKNFIGQIISEINTKSDDKNPLINSWNRRYNFQTRVTAFGYNDENKEDIIMGYSFSKLNVLNIKEKTSSQFDVSLDVETLIKYKDKQEDINSVFLISDPFSPKNSNFIVNLIYNRNNKSINISSISESSLFSWRRTIRI